LILLLKNLYVTLV